MKSFFAIAVLLGSLVVSPAFGQTFSSGSTGADGALNLVNPCPGHSASDNVCALQVPSDGVFHFTTINIPSNKILVFKRNLKNTPVYLLAQGAVLVQGPINVDAAGREPGQGGFWGGVWGYPSSGGMPGFGPGAGPQTDGSRHGRWVGPLSLVPPMGGSGGSGGGCDSFPNIGHDGSGGGGAIVIASSSSVTVSSQISANGGNFYFNPGCGGNSAWGFGSGGSIRIIGNSVTVSGSLSAIGGCNQYNGCGGASEKGVIRLEAPNGAINFSGSADPLAVLSSINPTIVASTPTILSIVSVGGSPVPSYAGQRFDTVDLLLPLQLPDPINVVVAASNIPVGTSVKLNFGTGNGGTVTPGTLTGTLASSTATVQVSGLNRAALAYLFVSASFGVASGAAPMNPPGPDQVAQVEVRAAPGAAPQFTFQRADGSAIDARRLPPDLLKYLRP